MHYYKRNIGDYHKKAGRLSMLEHGAYTLLIDSCYDRERFPSETDAIDWCWARSDEEIAAVRFVLSRFFTLVDGLYVQDRISEEIAGYKDRALKNKEIAENRERERREKRERIEHDSCTDRHLTINQEPLTKNQKKIKSTSAAARRDWVKELADLGVDRGHAKDWLEVRKGKNAKMTDTALKAVQREAAKAGITLAQAIKISAENAWQRFKAEWLINKGIGNGRTQASRPLSAVDRVKAGAAERERARKGAQPEYFDGGDFIEGEFATGPQVDGPPLDSYGGDLWAQVD